MNEYKRTAKSVDSKDNIKPPADNEVRISHSSITTYVNIGIKYLQEDKKKFIVLTGKGAFLNKAVTVVEIMKRKMQGSLHQYTQLGSVSVTEKWDAVDNTELD
ncbi:hypothetical protein BDB01DRAFT_780190, partial [Pilobolus umbonatus]